MDPSIHHVHRRGDLHRLRPLLQGLRHDVLAYEEVDEDDSAKMFMKVANPGNCIGCQACGRTCSKKCFTFEPVVM